MTTAPKHALPKGFIPVMLTPFQENGFVDYNGLRALTEFYLEAGAAGLFANCLSSEMFELSEQERIDVTQTVVDQVAGRVPVVATGTFGGPVLEQAKFVKRIYQTGVQAVIIISGLLADESKTDDVFLANAKELIDLTDDIPLGFYECPVPYKRLINSEVLAELLKSGRVVYHKDTCLDDEEVARRLAAGKDYEFGLYDAYMVNAVSSLKAGAAGLSCIQGNIYPELVVWICNNYNNPGRQEEVTQVQQFFIDTMDVVHAAYPIIAKYSLQKRGFPISLKTRREVGILTEDLKEGMDNLLEQAEKIQDELGIISVFNKYTVK
ncbi:dihydrodipicolinate synthase family protein [Dyadobacter psychrotolerans]|uniref:Dihydrodipicolinate synthase family protein n=1 Tax=Dyadobacter psychrotolerans TaxID=2541721 RepID=A0A4R5DNR4_9BACT|nr:dihydrodipicolinate synthase family protein [Dyadobacter psychrotolerans]TDE13794.1 dihydrodipicolinate synthase family protein [Dyadobacter psychrotolerans]